jgi:hypothetical protein
VIDFGGGTADDKGEGGSTMLRCLSLLCLTVCLLFTAAPATTACINDRESTTHEREFKSDYLEQQPAPPGPLASNHFRVGLASGMGIATIVLGVVTSTVVTLRRR